MRRKIEKKKLMDLSDELWTEVSTSSGRGALATSGPPRTSLSSADQYNTLYRPAEDDSSWADRCTLHQSAKEDSSSARVYRSAQEESSLAGRRIPPRLAGTITLYLPAEKYSSSAGWYNNVPARRGGFLLGVGGRPIQDCTGLPRRNPPRRASRV
ncbi:hypothetical protein PCANC_24674 [Puccinia coronata f. sp. avenae]|uniref:Uncharacterized protein n=1 Tax=Puccinia coronata f. sp. avenae TaxID=200324 RepID=A0A2N5TZ17_9BASI|nr:hypothetical protein PCANC_24674 [Puccinia coronata f. sp. avenae]